VHLLKTGGYFMKIQHFLALIPFIGLLGGVPFANKVTPYIFGMPFVLFYIVLWVVLTSGIMAIIFKLDPANKEEEI
jgi:pilus assembly protein TadC